MPKTLVLDTLPFRVDRQFPQAVTCKIYNMTLAFSLRFNSHDGSAIISVFSLIDNALIWQSKLTLNWLHPVVAVNDGWPLFVLYATSLSPTKPVIGVFHQGNFNLMQEALS